MKESSKPGEQTKITICQVVTSILILIGGSIYTAKGQYTVGQRVWTPPATGTFFSMALGGTNFPPTPFFPYNAIDVPVYSLNGNNSFIYDDTGLEPGQMLQTAPPVPGPGSGSTNYIPRAYSSYGSNDLWLEIHRTNNPADVVFLTLHGTTSTNLYQLQSKTNLRQTNWSFGQTLLSASDGSTDFNPVFTFGKPGNFFRAQKAVDNIRIVAGDNALEPTNSSPNSGHTGSFFLFRDSWSNDISLTVFYKVSGSATMGSDYTNIAGSNLVGSLTFPGGGSGIEKISIEPLPDNLVEFEESVTVTLTRTNGYLVPPDLESATIWISDNFGSNIFNVVATNLANAAGIGYHPVTNSLIVSVNSFTNSDINFVRIDTNGVISPWSAAHGNSEEKKLTIVQTTTNGFTRGETYFGADGNGIIGRISADGTAWTNAWASLTTDTNGADTLLRGSLYVDQTGLFGHDLIAVTGGDSGNLGGQVWKINSPTNFFQFTNVLNTHLEGLIGLTNDPQHWGPWAGKLITGAESESPPLIFAISTNKEIQSFDLKIEPEDFDIVQTNQDLYCISTSEQFTNAQLLKLSRTLLTNFLGQMLITQEGAQQLTNNPPLKLGKLFFVQWDNTTTNFVTRRISIDGFFEHSTFAPITLPNL